MVRQLTALAALAFSMSACSLSKDVSITLNGDQVITIQTAPDQVAGQTESPITIDPASAGSDYTDNKSHIDKVKVDDIVLKVVAVRSGNHATQLTQGTATLVNLSTGDSIDIALGAPVPLTLGATTTVSSFTPDPSDFLTTILKNADSFSIEAQGAIDQAPVDIDVQLSMDVTLTVSAF